MTIIGVISSESTNNTFLKPVDLHCHDLTSHSDAKSWSAWLSSKVGEILISQKRT